MTDEDLRPGARRGRGPSQSDVAKLAGVSGQTVSRVANGAPNVDAATRDRVISSMTALGYRPNQAARALRSGQFGTIGVIMFDLGAYGTTRTLSGITGAAAAAGYSVTLVCVTSPTHDGISAAFHELLGRPVDGIIIDIADHLDDYTVANIPPGLPVVVLDSRERYDFPVVDSDQVGGSALAVNHLLALGHETVFHVGGPDRSYSAISRRQAWLDSLVAAGRRVPEVISGDWSSQSGYRVGLQLAAVPEMTAVFAANDQMALGLLRAFHETGRRVPDDVSIVGFDNTPDASSYWPPLTTVHQDFDEVGRLSVEQVIAEIRGTGPVPGVTLVSTHLIQRLSTGPKQ